MKTRSWAKTLISVLWNFSRKPEAREIFSLNFRYQVEFIKNVQSIRKGVEKIFGIDRGRKNSPEELKSRKPTKKLEVSLCIWPGRSVYHISR